MNREAHDLSETSTRKTPPLRMFFLALKLLADFVQRFYTRISPISLGLIRVSAVLSIDRTILRFLRRLPAKFPFKLMEGELKQFAELDVDLARNPHPFRAKKNIV